MILIRNNRLSRQEIKAVKEALAGLSKSIKDTQTVPVTDAPKVGKGGPAPSQPRDVSTTESPNLLKRNVLSLVAKCRKDINEEDLPRVQDQLKDFFITQPRQPYYLLLDRRFERDDKRLVIIGDTHCDLKSLSALFEKLSLSSYDYFANATFVFLGDYLDRGSILFEYLLLLVGFKKLMGDRCIFLKGNHELIEYQSSLQRLESRVHPANTCPVLNTYCGSDKDFLSLFADYFSNLPCYLLLKTVKGTDLLVHGGIPKDAVMDKCTLSHETGELLVDGDDVVRKKVLYDMIWSDPRAEDVRHQGGESRFEFGRKQFEHFASINKINRIFRSHEPVQNGMMSFYGDRLFTIFSNGGAKNDISGYPEVENPVMAIMGVDGEVKFESIFFKKVSVSKGNSIFSTVLYMGAPDDDVAMRLDDLHLNNEFFVFNQ